MRKYLGICIAVALLGAVCVALAIVPAAAYPPGWAVQQQLQGAGVVSCKVARLQGQVCVAYRTTSNAICVRHSGDYGVTWGPMTCLDNGVYGNLDPAVVFGLASQQRCYVLFPGKRNGGGFYQTQVYTSQDWGATWSCLWRSAGSYNQDSVAAARVSDTGGIWFAFTDDSNGHEEVRNGTIGGDSVVEGTYISANDTVGSLQPAITCWQGNNAMVVWVDLAGNGWSRSHLMENRFDGAGWAGPVPIPDSGDEPNYRATLPSISYDGLFQVVYQGQNVSTGTYFVGEYVCSTLGFNWQPTTAVHSVIAATDGSAQTTVPKVYGRYDADIFYKNSSGLVSQLGGVDNFMGPTALASSSSPLSVSPPDPSDSNAYEFVASVDSGGLYVRRTDVVAPVAQITSPAFSGPEPVYESGNFAVSCSGAADDYNVDGTDVSTGTAYHNGIESVTYQSSYDGSHWEDLNCTSTNVAISPPFTVTVNAGHYNGVDPIKIKAAVKDSAGNTSDYTTPGWIYVDLNAPVSSLSVDGTKGTNNYYRSDATVTINHSDATYDHSEYQLENLDTKQKDSNWARYSAPFVLKEGHWKVYYRSYDKAGHTEGVKTGQVNIDETPPQCAIMQPDKAVIQTGYYSDDAFRMTGTGTDCNGLVESSFWIDGKRVYGTKDAFMMSYVWHIDRDGVKQDCDHTIEVRATDVAGNIGRIYKTVFVGNVAKDWYFAEGNTLPEMDEWLCVLNPGDTPCKYTVTFMLEDGTTSSIERSMTAHQRDTLKVKDYVPGGHTGVSVKIHSDSQGIVAERPMYFTYKKGVPGYNWKGGHDVVGINALQRDWFFAEGTTRMNDADGNQFEEWLTLQNADASKTANVKITYMLGTGQNIDKLYQVGPHSRTTVEVAKDIGVNQDDSVSISSDIPIAAERPMYFNYHRYALDGSDTVGAVSPQTQWSFSEGCTRPGYQEWLTIQNPNTVPAVCSIKYLTGTGKVNVVSRTVKPRSRDTVNVLQNVGSNQDVSTILTSDVPVIAERPMYYVYEAGVANRGWNGGDCTMGNPGPSRQYFFAEGTTISNFDTYYTLMNPNDSKGCNVVIDYAFSDGTTQEANYFIPAHARMTINVRDAIKKDANVSGSIIADWPIVIERPMYFNYDNRGLTGGHDVQGYGTD